MQVLRPAVCLREITFSPIPLLVWATILLAATASAQTPAAAPAPSVSLSSSPIAIVTLDSKIPGSAAMVTGALQVAGGKALIAANGSVTSGTSSTVVTLPRRGSLRICASTTVKLAADSSVPAGETPGLMMAMDRGAVEASFVTGQNADMLLTPDFRILIGGPGAANVKVRLGQGGDTCVDNPGGNAPYVLVTSVFDGGVYRVQPGQRVMFQHGSLQEVVDQEKEPCGCPPEPAEVHGNDFPLAQSEGLAPTPPPASAAPQHAGKSAQPAPPLVYNAGDSAPALQPPSGTASAASSSTQPPAQKRKTGVFSRIGHFFRRLFGAE